MSFIAVSREEWSASTRPTLGGTDHGDDGAEWRSDLPSGIATDEIDEVYRPLAALIKAHVASARALDQARGALVGRIWPAAAFVVSISGSVAAGKSTTARILQRVLAGGVEPERVEVVSVDGFLYSNAELAKRGSLSRKGFPHTYDTANLVRFLGRVKAGEPELAVPVYSHHDYDIVPGEPAQVGRADIIIVEGLHMLATGGCPPDPLLVSDLIDFPIYLDATHADLERWYIERFVALRNQSRAEPGFYQQFAAMDDEDLADLARSVWKGINQVNLDEHIEPTKLRALVILEKGPDHRVRHVRLRRR